MSVCGRILLGELVFFYLLEKFIYTPSLKVVQHMLVCFYLVDLVKKKTNKETKYEKLIA